MREWPSRLDNSGIYKDIHVYTMYILVYPVVNMSYTLLVITG
jgi:hypothetical protein